MRELEGERGRDLSDEGVDEVVDAALVLLTDETDVALLTPGLAPRVLDLPELLLLVSDTVADKENTVVEALAAREGEDTAEVELPHGGVNTDGERAVGVEGSDHLGLGAVDSLPARELVLASSSVVAGALSASVGILSLSVDTLADGIGHGIGHQTTVAAAVADLLALVLHAVVVAVDKLLLREERKLLVSNIVGTLGIAADAERPAGTAVALVLDGSHSTVLNPVLARGPVAELGAGGRKEITLDGRGIEGMEVELGELLLGEISELGHAETSTVGNILILLVESLDDLAVAHEVAEATRLLLGTAIEAVVLSLTSSPLLVDGKANLMSDTLKHIRKS